MKQYIREMDEEYRGKHYPKGSVFEKAAQESRRSNITLAVMAGAVPVLLAALNGRDVLACEEVTEEAGRELMKVLAQAHPAIQVHEGILEEGKEYDTWRESFRKVPQ